VVTVQRKFCKQSATCKRPTQHTISYLVEQLEEMGKLLNQQNVMVDVQSHACLMWWKKSQKNG